MTKAQAEHHVEGALLEDLIESGDMAQIEAIFAQSPPVEVARMISGITKSDQIRLLEMLGAEESAHLISKMSDLGAENLVTQLPTPQAVSIVREMSRDQQAHFLRTIDDDDAELVTSVLKAKANGGGYVNIQATASENLRVTDAESGLAIAKGDVTGTSFVHKFGATPDFDAADGNSRQPQHYRFSPRQHLIAVVVEVRAVEPCEACDVHPAAVENNSSAPEIFESNRAGPV